ncbi:MAG: SAP domain-containing protein [Methanomassiliicoccaceae archaeon]|jgi:hypothetical protein|nr:SAP domain-containing protein [Methanomassiliicoccaceae archaeon]
MADRPTIGKNSDGDTFRSFYYLKEELVSFCRREGLQSSGGKIELTNRIAHYIDTGEKTTVKKGSKKNPRADEITEDTSVEDNFTCSEDRRAFFKDRIGNSFSFNVTFQRWLKTNAGKTYREAIEAYHMIITDNKKRRSVIDGQFEYNAYIRDFFADNKDKSFSDAIKCWKHKKSIQGNNRYERADLIALYQFPL